MGQIGLSLRLGRIRFVKKAEQAGDVTGPDAVRVGMSKKLDRCERGGDIVDFASTIWFVEYFFASLPLCRFAYWCSCSCSFRAPDRAAIYRKESKDVVRARSDHAIVLSLDDLGALLGGRVGQVPLLSAGRFLLELAGDPLLEQLLALGLAAEAAVFELEDHEVAVVLGLVGLVNEVGQIWHVNSWGEGHDEGTMFHSQ
jgi:hypothetical protein